MSDPTDDALDAALEIQMKVLDLVTGLPAEDVLTILTTTLCMAAASVRITPEQLASNVRSAAENMPPSIARALVAKVVD